MNFPKYISIQTTSICNAECVFCPYPETKKSFPAKIMDESLYRKIIDEASFYSGVERIILYMNNEPLTDPYLIDRINYAKSKMPQATVHLLTNGALLTEDISRKLIDSSLDWVGVSFHGITQNTIEKSMKIDYKKTLNRILRFIDLAKEKKNLAEYFMITFLKHEYLSEQEKNEAINFWESHGVSRISHFDGPISRAGNVKRISKNQNQNKIIGCNSIWAEDMLHIVEDGKVVLCCMDWRRKVILGDLNKERIEDVWNGERKRVWGKIYGESFMEDDFLCRNCEEAKSMSLAENKSKSLKGQSEMLLAICPAWGIDTPPLSLASLSSYLRSKGIPVVAIDYNIDSYSKVSSENKKLWGMENSHFWWVSDLFETEIKAKLENEIERIAEEIIIHPANIVGFSVYSSNRLFTREVIKLVRKKSKKTIIVGGRGVYDALERRNFSPDLVDHFVIGEGEEALCKLLREGLVKKGDKGIDGLIDDLEKEVAPTFLKDLNSFPLINYDDFDLNLYKEKAICLLMNRGCVFHCEFCSDWQYIGSLRTRSPHDIYKEIENYYHDYGIKKLYFNDQAINANPKGLNLLCDLLIEALFKVDWVALAIPWKFLDLKMLLKMKKAGCITLNYGVESGSDDVLKLMSKDLKVKDIEIVLENTRKAGINTQLNFVVGFPGETESDFNQTKEFIGRNAHNICGITNLNMCNVVLNSNLRKEKEKFNIKLSDNLEIADTHWELVDGSNNYEIRKRRLEDAIFYLKNFKNIKIFTTNRQISRCKISEKEKCNIVLVNLPPWDQDNPHIGIGYLCEYLKSKGLTPKIIDLNKRFFIKFHDYQMLWHVENKAFWQNDDTLSAILRIFDEEIEEAIHEIISFDCSIIGFSAIDPKEKLIIEFVKRIKALRPDKKIILGGPSTSTPEQRQIFLDSIDKLIEVFVVGEGEETLCRVIERLMLKGNAKEVGGCYYRDNKKWVYEPKKQILSLEKIPFPKYEDFDFDAYGLGSSILVEWSRGCKSQCAFCKNFSLFPRYRAKSVDWIMNELSYHKEKNNVNTFTVVDSILNGDLGILNGVCDRIIKEDLNVAWSGQIAPHRDMTLDLFKKMKKAGCIKLQIGLESGSNKVLKLMRKPFTAEISEQNIRFAKEAGIETEIFVIVGFPGEDDKEFKKTYNFIKRNKDYIDTIKSINTLHLIAGTEVYEKAQSDFNMRRFESSDWHYLWQTYDGNNYKVRKKRAKVLLDLAKSCGIKVLETNIHEGKDKIGLLRVKKNDRLGQLNLMKLKINSLNNLSEEGTKARTSRSMLKIILLICVSLYTFIYIVYFWIFMHLTNRALLGGTRKSDLK